MRARRKAERDRRERALANLEHKVRAFGVEMQSEIDSLRAELLAENKRGERDLQDA